MKLAIATALRALRAEHRADVVPTRDRLLSLHTVRQVGASGTGCTLRAQHVRLVAALDLEHLLFDDLRGLPRGTHEQVLVLEDRRPNLGETAQGHRVAEGLLDALPASDLVGEDIVRPLDGAKLHDFQILKDRAGHAAADRAYARMGGSGQARVPFFADERVPMLNTPGMRAAAVDLGKVRIGLAV